MIAFIFCVVCSVANAVALAILICYIIFGRRTALLSTPFIKKAPAIRPVLQTRKETASDFITKDIGISAAPAAIRPIFQKHKVTASDFVTKDIGIPVAPVFPVPKHKHEDLRWVSNQVPSHSYMNQLSSVKTSANCPDDMHQQQEFSVPLPLARPVIVVNQPVQTSHNFENEEDHTVQATPTPGVDYTAGDAEIHILCYNVRCDKDAAPFSWIQRKKHIIRAIQDTGMSIVCLQEAKQEYAQDVCRALGLHWRLAGVPRRQSDEGTQILHDSRHFRFLETSTWVFHDEGIRLCPPSTHCTEQSFLGRRRCAHVRIFTHSILMHIGSEICFNVINTHFPLEGHEQEICARQLATYVQERTDLSYPTIICGDFNAHYAPETPGKPMMLLLEGLPGLIDAHDGLDFPTYHEGFDGDVLLPGQEYTEKQPSHRLDYVLVRIPEGSAMRLVRGDIHHSRYVGADGGSYRPSDHEPISATLVLLNNFPTH